MEASAPHLRAESKEGGAKFGCHINNKSAELSKQSIDDTKQERNLEKM
jgi:hypothetical protein